MKNIGSNDLVSTYWKYGIVASDALPASAPLEQHDTFARLAGELGRSHFLAAKRAKVI
jgi:hypothetical protein